LGFVILAGGLLVIAGGIRLLVQAVRSRHIVRGVAGTAAVLASGLFLWRAANDPGADWFGQVDSHGPRDGRQVAITFDDGPDPNWSAEVARILADHGAPATFFLVGKAVDRWPDEARALRDAGHQIGNHSYHHDYWRWLDPRYPELDRTQDAIQRELDLCPATYRPPHGQRTPFLLHHVDAAGMRTVTWDVSAEDWEDDDGERVARRILDQVEPGSIILLHDGLDGKGTASREVLTTALPLILEGLAAADLTPVRLDELLDASAYLDAC
jgi:peptidoglycan-N-acetylglucosamine deacetylase